MEQPVEKMELAIDVRLHHACEVELDVARLGKPRAVAQKSQLVVRW